jgi:methyltransferase (TIGR00027 family)
VKGNKPSQMAEYDAFARAFESSRRPSAARLFNDPFAYSCLRPRLKATIQLSRVPLLGAVERRLIYQRHLGALSLVVGRTRLIDDYLSASIHDGIDQVVILGSGFDCRAYRTPDINHVNVVELDFPTTLSRKKKRMRRIFAELPTNVTYVDVDFNSQPLSQVLHDSGLALNRRSFFIWEGVTQYLTEQAVDEVLRYVGRETAPGSRIVFTYVHEGALDGSAEFADAPRLWKRLQRLNEPLTFGIYPDSLKAYLASRGLDLLESLGASEYRERYMGPSAHQIKGGEFYRVAYAQRRSAA